MLCGRRLSPTFASWSQRDSALSAPDVNHHSYKHTAPVRGYVEFLHNDTGIGRSNIEHPAVGSTLVPVPGTAAAPQGAINPCL